MSVQINNINVIDDDRNISAGIVTANEFVGTGDNLIFSPTATSFSPNDGATGVSALSSPDISITYDQLMIFGSGDITLRKDSPTGTVAETYTVGVSTRATISNQTLTLSPEGVASDGNFDYDTDYYVVIPSGAVKNAIAGVGVSLTSYNFSTEAGPTVTSFSPGIGSTSIDTNTNIVITFDKTIRAGLGTITLRTVSAGGTITESYDVSSSNRLTFSTNTLTIDPTSDLSLNTNYYVVIPDDAVAGYTGISTYEFTTTDFSLTAFGGGYLICQSGGTQWIVAPSSTEVSRNFHCRADAVTTANANAACGDWFVPTCGQIKNPGYTCRAYWDSYCPTRYWSNDANSGSGAWSMRMNTGEMVGSFRETSDMSDTNCVRAFRCVSY